MNFFQKLKLELNLFQQYFTPTPTLKQGESKTTLDPDTSPAHPSYAHQLFRKRFKSRSPMSDLVTRYGPQAPTRYTCLV